MEDEMKNLIFASILCILITIVYTDSYAEIKVVKIKGQAAFRTTGSWVPLQAGAILPIGAKISTGPKTSVEINIDKHTVTIGSLSFVKVYHNEIKKDEITTKLGLRRGTIKARVFRTKEIKTTFTISTPVATSSVRGTEKVVFHGPRRGTKARVIKGKIGVTSRDTLRNIAGRHTFNQNPDSQSPDDLLADARGEATSDTSPKNITREEENNAFYDDMNVSTVNEIYKDCDKYNDRNISNPQALVPTGIIVIWP
jgi:hypothetical protein